MKRVYYAILTLLVSAAALDGAEIFTLVHAGRVTAQIVTGRDAPETVGFAARELQAYVQKMSGATLPITADTGRARC